MAEVEDSNQLAGQQQCEEDDENERKEMKPWEQHSSVISIPRFDYNAPSSLLHHSHSGFLITCPIKREKSATKEAISILSKYIESSENVGFGESDSCKNDKRRKLGQVEEDPAIIAKIEQPTDESQSCELTESSVKQTPPSLMLVKLTGSGLLLLTFSKGTSSDPVSIVSNVNQSLESGALKRPLWCHRIFPIQATCRLMEKDLRTTVSNLVLKYVDDKSNRSSRPLKFAVGFNRRGIEEAEMKKEKDDINNPLLRRDNCFTIVGDAVKEVVSDSTVDLKSPELCILIELLPVSGMPNGSIVAAISVLSRDLVTTKPRLCIKALVIDSKAKK